jgi:hypothetical protein
MTERELADLLHRAHRVLSEEDVARVEHEHDIDRGEWVANQVVHHEPQESRH